MIHKIKQIIVYTIVFIFIIKSNFYDCKEKKIVMDVQRPLCTTHDPRYIKNVSCTSKRYNRSNHIHYLTIYGNVVRPLDDNFIITFSFYQLLTNVYKRSFVEYSVKMCDVLTEKLIGPMLIEAYYRTPASLRPMKTFSCPIQPGLYRFEDMKIPLIALPATFPFSEGRIYVNITHPKGWLISGHFDFKFI